MSSTLTSSIITTTIVVVDDAHHSLPTYWYLPYILVLVHYHHYRRLCPQGIRVSPSCSHSTSPYALTNTDILPTFATPPLQSQPPPSPPTTPSASQDPATHSMCLASSRLSLPSQRPLAHCRHQEHLFRLYGLGETIEHIARRQGRCTRAVIQEYNSSLHPTLWRVYSPRRSGFAFPMVSTSSGECTRQTWESLDHTALPPLPPTPSASQDQAMGSVHHPPIALHPMLSPSFLTHSSTISNNKPFEKVPGANAEPGLI
ncbi:hypothetical protein BDQ12DRAFT_726962 [Crucibulum laeve]|uniref:Uncharacterized protein n=1 Tax=Crucibulum laeve TaxID=68775 RepID=A0A5C3LQ38_9AGAR|nr:hypothetical protein BDQ12DRAFT_726962 [Crucibulum laeve]